MTAPKRIQQRRTAGWRKPEGAVAVGRGTKWGNPWKVGDPDAYWTGPGYTSPRRPDPIPRMDAEHVVALYESALRTGNLAVTPDDARAELAGRDLMCWCPLDQPCHADVLLELANGATDD